MTASMPEAGARPPESEDEEGGEGWRSGGLVGLLGLGESVVAVVEPFGLGDLDEFDCGGKGGRPPLPRPLRMVRVSWRR